MIGVNDKVVAEVWSAVMERDHSTCVVCEALGVTVASILDERLWDAESPDQWNYVCVCMEHLSEISFGKIHPQAIQEIAGLVNISIPTQCYESFSYDRWANQILNDGRRVRGELFWLEDVQAILASENILKLFVPWAKYPRTFLLPWVEAPTFGDKKMTNASELEGQRVIVTEKMDGENITIYREYFHGRSVDGPAHPSRDWLKTFIEVIGKKIPDGLRLCGEYLYARHSVSYSDLESYFLGFSVWDQHDQCLSWDETIQVLESLAIKPVAVLYDGIFDPIQIDAAWRRSGLPDSEGYIVRSAGRMTVSQFRHKCGKFIRNGYVQSEPIRDNRLHGRPIKVNSLG
ncbi:RNA ligase family protein [Pseudomonas syringae]|uniref:RNA ligase family protein n=1 Tax=Pseudomonas syringae TaxID=317 RepID=UPI003F87ED3A